MGGRALPRPRDEARRRLGGSRIARIIYHLDVQHPEAHPTLEQAEEFVATEAYEAL
jgi:hypothetical protein